MNNPVLSFITILTLCMWFPHIAIDFVFVLDMAILYFLATRFRWYAIVCNSSSDVAIIIWSSAYSMVFSIFLLLHKYLYQLISSNFLFHYFFFLALQPPSGVVFYSPLAGFSLLACEVS